MVLIKCSLITNVADHARRYSSSDDQTWRTYSLTIFLCVNDVYKCLVRVITQRWQTFGENSCVLIFLQLYRGIIYHYAGTLGSSFQKHNYCFLQLLIRLCYIDLPDRCFNTTIIRSIRITCPPQRLPLSVCLSVDNFTKGLIIDINGLTREQCFMLKTIQKVHVINTNLTQWELPANWSKGGSLPYIELIRRGVRKNSLMCKFVHATFLKLYHNWLCKWTFHDMNHQKCVMRSVTVVLRGLKGYDSAIVYNRLCMRTHATIPAGIFD